MPAPSESLSAPAILASLLALLVTLSVATERLVEIVKNLPVVGEWLRTDNTDTTWEGVRRLVLQLLAIGTGVGTVLLSRSILPVIVGTFVNGADTKTQACWLLGLLASGGSGFWTSVLGYVNSVKDIKKTKAVGARVQTAATVAAIANGAAATVAMATVQEVDTFKSLEPGDSRPVKNKTRNDAHDNLEKAIQLANATL